MNRRFIRQVVWFAVLYYVAVLLLDGAIFLISHFPPKVINLDWLILGLGDLARFFAWPKTLLRKLWPGESTPTGLNFMLAVINCLIWGIILSGLKAAWVQVRK